MAGKPGIKHPTRLMKLKKRNFAGHVELDLELLAHIAKCHQVTWGRKTNKPSFTVFTK